MQTHAQKDCFGECSLFYTFLNYVVVLFLQSTHFFDNWKKQKIILRKSEKETFLKEGDQNSRTGTQPPHPSTKINSQTAIHK